MVEFLDLLFPAIGKQITSPEVREFFDERGIEGNLTIDDDDYETYVESPFQGFSLNVIDQPFIKNPAYSGKERGVLIFRGCHFYSEGYENYEQFKEAMPFDLTFDDSRELAIQKLGESAWTYEKNGNVKRERWEFADTDRQLNVTYANDEKSIKIIYFGIREFFTK